MDDSNCCSGNSLTGEICQADNGNYDCSWECSDENLDENGIPEACHPFYNEYDKCHQRHKQMKAELLLNVKSELSNVGGILTKGVMTTNQGEHVVFDKDTCNSRSDCLNKLTKSVNDLVAQYEDTKQSKTVELEQLKEKYRMESGDVCLSFGEDGFCERFKTASVPSDFMIVSKTDKMDVFARKYDQMLIDASLNGGKKNPETIQSLPDGLYMDTHPAFCWSRMGKEYVPCDPTDDDQRFVYKVEEKKDKACSGMEMDRDTAAPLAGYTPESCKYLCDKHANCSVASYDPVKDMPDGSRSTGIKCFPATLVK